MVIVIVKGFLSSSFPNRLQATSEPTLKSHRLADDTGLQTGHVHFADIVDFAAEREALHRHAVQ